MVTSPEQWHHVPTDQNPADVATRDSPANLKERLRVWHEGAPQFVSKQIFPEEFALVSPDSDTEIRPVVLKTRASSSSLPYSTILSRRFEKFSTWTSLVRAFRFLKPKLSKVPQEQTEVHGTTKAFLIGVTQAQTYFEEITCLKNGKAIPKSSPISSLNPFLDTEGLLRVGGRLHEAEGSLGLPMTHPLILPKGHHVSILLVRHYHAEVKHQGRHFTEGALRCAGFWVVGAKRLIGSIIQKCFTCRRLRGKPAGQQMANLPVDRVTPSPPFSCVGVDVFGPWEVLTRKTRGGQANSKRWAVIFSCMACRAIHIEVIEEMSSSSFINALRRFVAIRGPVSEMRSDRGTNFVGAADELSFTTLLKEDGPVQAQLLKSGIVWRFNPPHASHMGGVWERMIGVTRRILDSMLLDARRKPLTHEVLCTLMAEVCAVVNSRPITPVTHDPESPLILSPSLLLTQKCQETQPLPDFDNFKDTYVKQWKHVQVLSNVFWKRWRQEYLSSLQARPKWKNEHENLQPDTLVLLKDTTPRGDWPMGLVTRTFPSDSDGLVRSAEVRVVKDGQSRLYVRPITDLIRL